MAVPVSAKFPAVTPDTGSLKLTVKVTVAAFVRGPPARAMAVTTGARLTVTVAVGSASTAGVLSSTDTMPEMLATTRSGRPSRFTSAADTDSGPLQLRLGWDQAEMLIRIRDHGPGIDLAIAGQLGKAFVSNKKGKGLGLGLFLSSATAERYGGEIRLYNHPHGGTEAELRLPITPERA